MRPPGRPQLRVLAAGGALALLYVAVVVLTAALSPRPVRPLFDGFAPPEPYRWVSPPPDLAEGNEQPDSARREVALDPQAGSEISNVTTSDGQALVSLELGSVAPHAPDTAVAVELVPVDPTTVAPLPDGLRPAGNAYRVTFAYQPSGTPVTTLDPTGDIGLSAAATSDTMLFSPATGAAWQVIESRPYGTTHGQSGILESPGFYLVAATSAGDGEDDGAGGTVAVVVLLGLVPVIAGVALWATRHKGRGQGGGRGGGKGRSSPNRARSGSSARSRRPPPKKRRR